MRLAMIFPALFLWACTQARLSGDADHEAESFLSGFVAASSAGGADLPRYYLPSATISGLLEAPATPGTVRTWTLPEFTAWMDTMSHAYEYVRFRLVRSDFQRYGDVAQARLVLEVREKPNGKPERTVHSLDQLHLFRVDGEWRISAHAWTMEKPDQPLVARGDW